MPRRSVAVVTGAGQGIGRAVAIGLAARGAATVVLDIDSASAEAVASEIAIAGGEVIAIGCDVTSLADMRAAVGRAESAFGPVDVLVNNAGVSSLSQFLDGDPAQWDRLIGVNLVGVLNTCHAVLPGMVALGRGSIVNVASDAARAGVAGEAVYSAAKGGVISFTKSLAAEVAKAGVRVNVVSPSTTDTPMMRSVLNEDQIQRRARWVPLGRVGQPEDIAEVVAFFASDSASYVTGQVLSVNGGSLRFG